LSPQHQELLHSSGITPEVAEQRGYWTATKKSELTELGFSAHQRKVPALVIPLREIKNEIETYQIRPDTPRIGKDGRPIKYETPGDSRPVRDIPEGARRALRNTAVPLWITEGSRKVDAAVSAGLPCVGLLGVWPWAQRINAEARTVLPALFGIASEGRQVVLAFDSDVMEKPSVHLALEQLGEWLRSQGAIPSYCYLPAEPGQKVGLDDYLASGHSLDDLHALVEDTLRPLPAEPRPPARPTAELLDRIRSLLRRYMIYPSEHEDAALALHVLHTYAFDAAAATPYVYVRSPMRQAGKSRQLEVLEALYPNALHASTITAAAVFQAISKWRPTLLIDEADAIFKQKTDSAEALRGVLNAGNRPGASAVRGTQDGEPAMFSTYCPKVLAGIDSASSMPEPSAIERSSSACSASSRVSGSLRSGRGNSRPRPPSCASTLPIGRPSTPKHWPSTSWTRTSRVSPTACRMPGNRCSPSRTSPGVPGRPARERPPRR
jgi:hypothetical protein